MTEAKGPRYRGISSEYVLAIGHVAINAGEAEVFQQTLLVELLGASPEVQFMVLGQPFDQTAQTIRAIVVKIPDQQLKEQIKGVLARAEQAWSQRNDVIHGLWLADVQDASRRSILRPRRRGGTRPTHWTILELTNLAAELRTVANELDALAYELEHRRSADDLWGPHELWST
jgi:hypothetical protein